MIVILIVITVSAANFYKNENTNPSLCKQFVNFRKKIRKIGGFKKVNTVPSGERCHHIWKSLASAAADSAAAAAVQVFWCWQSVNSGSREKESKAKPGSLAHSQVGRHSGSKGNTHTLSINVNTTHQRWHWWRRGHHLKTSTASTKYHHHRRQQQ